MIRDVVGDGSRFGLKVEYSFDGAEAARHRRRLAQGACRCSARRSSSSTATRTCRGLRGGRSGFRAQPASPALMTVYSNRRSVGYAAMCCLRDGGSIDYDKKRRTPGHAAHRLRAGACRTGRVLDGDPADEAFDLADVYQDFARGRTGRLRSSASASTRSGRPRGLRRRVDYFEQGRTHDELRAAASRGSGADRREHRRRRDRAHGGRCLPTCKAAGGRFSSWASAAAPATARTR